MKNKLLSIINHYGVTNQLKHLQGEVFELNEAVITHEIKSSIEYEIPLTEIVGTKEHIAEEIAYCYVMIEQIRNYYEITNEELTNIMNFKIKRTLKRIEEESSLKHIFGNISKGLDGITIRKDKTDE